jgi:hypothetical protein
MGRGIRYRVLGIATAALLIVGATACASRAVTPLERSEEPSSVESPAPSASFGAELTCPGDHWPPDDLSGIPGIDAVARDRATIEIRNGTSARWFFRVDAWEVARLETCVGLLPLELERGPIEPGAVIQVPIGQSDKPDQPLTVSFWDRPCGEACNRAPQHPILVDRSPIEPGSS